MLTLSSCSTWTETPSTPEEAADKPILMPSISRGINRNHDEQKEKEETPAPTEQATESAKPEPTESTKVTRKADRIPTAEQQEAAIEAIKNNSSPQITPVNPTPPAETIVVPAGVISTPTTTPLSPEPVPVSEEEDEPEILPAPRPTSIELRGLRTPGLPNVLPMEVKG